MRAYRNRLIPPDECCRSALGLERAPHMMGMGMGVGFSAPPPWTPAALSPTLWLGAYEEARGTKNTQPVPNDWNMERADTTRWVPNGSCTVSKEISDPSPAGGQWLKVTRSTVDYYVQQWNVAITGNRYRLRGWMKTSGCNGVYFTPGVAIPGSASWVAVNDEQTWGGTYFYLGCNGGVAGAWSGWDDMQLENLSLTSYTPKIGAALTQATPTAMPWAGALGMMFDGDLLPWGGAADAKCMHTGGGGSLGWQYRPTTLKAENRIVATAATAVGNVGVCVSCTNANTIRVRVMNGGAAYDYDSGDVACAIAINTTYTMMLRVAAGAGGVSLRVNGVEVISGALTAPSAANATTGLMFGGDAAGAASNVTGYIGQALVVQRALTVAECAQYEAYVAKEGL